MKITTNKTENRDRIIVDGEEWIIGEMYEFGDEDICAVCWKTKNDSFRRIRKSKEQETIHIDDIDFDKHYVVGVYDNIPVFLTSYSNYRFYGARLGGESASSFRVDYENLEAFHTQKEALQWLADNVE